MIAYGYASAGSVLRGRRAPELLAGGGTARRHPTRRQPADPLAREAARPPARRPLRPSRRTDGGRAPSLPQRAAAARTRGAAARGARRGGRRRARRPTRDRRFHGARRPGAARRARRVPAAAPGRACRALGVGHAARDRAGRAARGRARSRRRRPSPARRRLRALLSRRGRARGSARPSLRRPQGHDRRAERRAARAHAGGSRRSPGDRGRAARDRRPASRPRRPARARTAGVGAQRGDLGQRRHVHLQVGDRSRRRRRYGCGRAGRGPRTVARDLARAVRRPRGDARRPGLRRVREVAARVIVRWGLASLPEVCEAAGVRKPLLIASPRWDDLAIEAEARWREVPSARIDDAASQAGGGVIALGGGSAIDLGKAVSAAAGVPLVSIPTTYAGAEWTTYYGVRDPGRKLRGGGGGADPRGIVYDVDLTLDLPRETTVGTSMNALAHCAEALYVRGHNV